MPIIKTPKQKQDIKNYMMLYGVLSDIWPGCSDNRTTTDAIIMSDRKEEALKYADLYRYYKGTDLQKKAKEIIIGIVKSVLLPNSNLALDEVSYAGNEI